MNLQVFMALSASTVAVCMDLLLYKVKNWWICVIWFCGMVYQLLGWGWPGVWLFLKGSAVPIVILSPLFLFRMLGPGDIKLFSALGGIMGMKAILSCICVSFFIGGALSFVILLSCGSMKARLQHFAGYVQSTFQTGRIIPYYVAGGQPENLHFTVAILLGVLCYAGGVY